MSLPRTALARKVIMLGREWRSPMGLRHFLGVIGMAITDWSRSHVFLRLAQIVARLAHGLAFRPAAFLAGGTMERYENADEIW
jgi:hypothetical protein